MVLESALAIVVAVIAVVVVPAFFIVNVLWSPFQLQYGPGGGGSAAPLMTYVMAAMRIVSDFIFITIPAFFAALVAFFVFIYNNWKLFAILALVAVLSGFAATNSSQALHVVDIAWHSTVGVAFDCAVLPLARALRGVANTLVCYNNSVNRSLSNLWFGALKTAFVCGEDQVWALLVDAGDLATDTIFSVLQYAVALVFKRHDANACQLNVSLILRDVLVIVARVARIVECFCGRLYPLTNIVHHLATDPNLPLCVDGVYNGVSLSAQQIPNAILDAIYNLAQMVIHAVGSGGFDWAAIQALEVAYKRPNFMQPYTRLVFGIGMCGKTIDSTLQVTYDSLVVNTLNTYSGVPPVVNRPTLQFPKLGVAAANVAGTLIYAQGAGIDLLLHLDLLFVDSYLSCTRQCSECIYKTLAVGPTSNALYPSKPECESCLVDMQFLPAGTHVNNGSYTNCSICINYITPTQIAAEHVCRACIDQPLSEASTLATPTCFTYWRPFYYLIRTANALHRIGHQFGAAIRVFRLHPQPPCHNLFELATFEQSCGKCYGSSLPLVQCSWQGYNVPPSIDNPFANCRDLNQFLNCSRHYPNNGPPALSANAAIGIDGNGHPLNCSSLIRSFQPLFHTPCVNCIKAWRWQSTADRIAEKCFDPKTVIVNGLIDDAAVVVRTLFCFASDILRVAHYVAQFAFELVLALLQPLVGVPASAGWSLANFMSYYDFNPIYRTTNSTLQCSCRLMHIVVSPYLGMACGNLTSSAVDAVEILVEVTTQTKQLYESGNFLSSLPIREFFIGIINFFENIGAFVKQGAAPSGGCPIRIVGTISGASEYSIRLNVFCCIGELIQGTGGFVTQLIRMVTLIAIDLINLIVYADHPENTKPKRDIMADLGTGFSELLQHELASVIDAISCMSGLVFSALPCPVNCRLSGQSYRSCQPDDLVINARGIPSIGNELHNVVGDFLNITAIPIFIALDVIEFAMKGALNSTDVLAPKCRSGAGALEFGTAPGGRAGSNDEGGKSSSKCVKGKSLLTNFFVNLAKHLLFPFIAPIATFGQIIECLFSQEGGAFFVNIAVGLENFVDTCADATIQLIEDVVNFFITLFAPAQWGQLFQDIMNIFADLLGLIEQIWRGILSVIFGPTIADQLMVFIDGFLNLIMQFFQFVVEGIMTILCILTLGLVPAFCQNSFLHIDANEKVAADYNCLAATYRSYLTACVRPFPYNGTKAMHMPLGDNSVSPWEWDASAMVATGVIDACGSFLNSLRLVDPKCADCVLPKVDTSTARSLRVACMHRLIEPCQAKDGFARYRIDCHYCTTIPNNASYGIVQCANDLCTNPPGGMISNCECIKYFQPWAVPTLKNSGAPFNFVGDTTCQPCFQNLVINGVPIAQSRDAPGVTSRVAGFWDVAGGCFGYNRGNAPAYRPCIGTAHASFSAVCGCHQGNNKGPNSPCLIGNGTISAEGMGADDVRTTCGLHLTLFQCYKKLLAGTTPGDLIRLNRIQNCKNFILCNGTASATDPYLGVGATTFRRPVFVTGRRLNYCNASSTGLELRTSCSNCVPPNSAVAPFVPGLLDESWNKCSCVAENWVKMSYWKLIEFCFGRKMIIPNSQKITPIVLPPPGLIPIAPGALCSLSASMPYVKYCMTSAIISGCGTRTLHDCMEELGKIAATPVGLQDCLNVIACGQPGIDDGTITTSGVFYDVNELPENQLCSSQQGNILDTMLEWSVPGIRAEAYGNCSCPFKHYRNFTVTDIFDFCFKQHNSNLPPGQMLANAPYPLCDLLPQQGRSALQHYIKHCAPRCFGMTGLTLKQCMNVAATGGPDVVSSLGQQCLNAISCGDIGAQAFVNEYSFLDSSSWLGTGGGGNVENGQCAMASGLTLGATPGIRSPTLYSSCSCPFIASQYLTFMEVIAFCWEFPLTTAPWPTQSPVMLPITPAPCNPHAKALYRHLCGTFCASSPATTLAGCLNNGNPQNVPCQLPYVTNLAQCNYCLNALICDNPSQPPSLWPPSEPNGCAGLGATGFVSIFQSAVGIPARCDQGAASAYCAGMQSTRYGSCTCAMDYAFTMSYAQILDYCFTPDTYVLGAPTPAPTPPPPVPVVQPAPCSQTAYLRLQGPAFAFPCQVCMSYSGTLQDCLLSSGYGTTPCHTSPSDLVGNVFCQACLNALICGATPTDPIFQAGTMTNLMCQTNVHSEPGIQTLGCSCVANYMTTQSYADILGLCFSASFVGSPTPMPIVPPPLNPAPCPSSAMSAAFQDPSNCGYLLGCGSTMAACLTMGSTNFMARDILACSPRTYVGATTSCNNCLTMIFCDAANTVSISPPPSLAQANGDFFQSCQSGPTIHDRLEPGGCSCVREFMFTHSYQQIVQICFTGSILPPVTPAPTADPLSFTSAPTQTPLPGGFCNVYSFINFFSAHVPAGLGTGCSQFSNPGRNFACDIADVNTCFPPTNYCPPRLDGGASCRVCLNALTCGTGQLSNPGAGLTTPFSGGFYNGLSAPWTCDGGIDGGYPGMQSYAFGNCMCPTLNAFSYSYPAILQGCWPANEFFLAVTYLFRRRGVDNSDLMTRMLRGNSTAAERASIFTPEAIDVLVSKFGVGSKFHDKWEHSQNYTSARMAPYIQEFAKRRKEYEQKQRQSVPAPTHAPTYTSSPPAYTRAPRVLDLTNEVYVETDSDEDGDSETEIKDNEEVDSYTGDFGHTNDEDDAEDENDDYATRRAKRERRILRWRRQRLRDRFDADMQAVILQDWSNATIEDISDPSIYVNTKYADAPVADAPPFAEMTEIWQPPVPDPYAGESDLDRRQRTMRRRRDVAAVDKLGMSQHDFNLTCERIQNEFNISADAPLESRCERVVTHCKDYSKAGLQNIGFAEVLDCFLYLQIARAVNTLNPYNDTALVPSNYFMTWLKPLQTTQMALTVLPLYVKWALAFYHQNEIIEELLPSGATPAATMPPTPPPTPAAMAATKHLSNRPMSGEQTIDNHTALYRRWSRHQRDVLRDEHNITVEVPQNYSTNSEPAKTAQSFNYSELLLPEMKAEAHRQIETLINNAYADKELVESDHLVRRIIHGSHDGLVSFILWLEDVLLDEDEEGDLSVNVQIGKSAKSTPPPPPTGNARSRRMADFGAYDPSEAHREARTKEYNDKIDQLTYAFDRRRQDIHDRIRELYVRHNGGRQPPRHAIRTHDNRRVKGNLRLKGLRHTGSTFGRATDISYKGLQIGRQFIRIMSAHEVGPSLIRATTAWRNYGTEPEIDSIGDLVYGSDATKFRPASSQSTSSSSSSSSSSAYTGYHYDDITDSGSDSDSDVDYINARANANLTRKDSSARNQRQRRDIGPAPPPPTPRTTPSPTSDPEVIARARAAAEEDLGRWQHAYSHAAAYTKEALMRKLQNANLLKGVIQRQLSESTREFVARVTQTVDPTSDPYSDAYVDRDAFVDTEFFGFLTPEMLKARRFDSLTPDEVVEQRVYIRSPDGVRTERRRQFEAQRARRSAEAPFRHEPSQQRFNEDDDEQQRRREQRGLFYSSPTPAPAPTPASTFGPVSPPSTCLTNNFTCDFCALVSVLPVDDSNTTTPCSSITSSSFVDPCDPCSRGTFPPMNYSLPQQDLINVNGSNCLPSSPGSSGCFNCTILTNSIVPAINSALSCFVGEGIHNCLSLPSPTYVSTYLFPTFYGAGVVLPNSTTNPTLDPTSPSFSIGNWLLVTLSQIVGFVIGQPIDLLALSNYLVDFLTSTQLDIDACSLPGAIFPDCKVGLLYYIKTLISCNWCNMNQCQEGWGLEKALLAILLAFVIVSIVVSLFLDFLSPFLIILWFYYPLTVICFAYNVHPTCLLSTFPYIIPSFPVCLFDDVCTLLHNIAYDYFPWEVILPGLLITGPGGTRTFLPCASIGFTGIVNELFFALQWALPRVTNFLRTTDIVFFSWIRDVTVIATGLSTFTFTGSPTDAQVSCFLINLLSLVPIVLIGILAIYLLVLLIPIIVAFLLLLRDLAAIFILFMVALLKRNASKQARLDSQSVAESGRLPITDTLDPSANAITVTLPPSQASALPLHHQQMPPTQVPLASARERALLWEEPAQPTRPPPVDMPGYAGTLQPPERSGVRELAGALQRGVNSLRKRKNG